MKKTIVILAALASTTAFANFTRTVTPQILLENGFAFQSVDVTNICQTEDGNFKTISAVKKCTKFSRTYRSRFDMLNDDNRNCLEYGKIDLFAPATKKVGVCVEWGRGQEDGCTRVEYSEVQRPLTYTIKKVRYARTPGDDDFKPVRVLSSKEYTISSCN